MNKYITIIIDILHKFFFFFINLNFFFTSFKYICIEY